MVEKQKRSSGKKTHGKSKTMKKRKYENKSSNSSNSSCCSNNSKAVKKTKGNCVWESDNEDEDYTPCGPVPLPSLENEPVKDFSSSSSQPSEKDAKVIRADKITWRKFHNSTERNKKFNTYYQEQFQWSDQEWKRFISVLDTPLPVTFRVNGARRMFAEPLRAVLNDIQFNGVVKDSVKHETGEFEMKKMILTSQFHYWKINASSKDMRKLQSLQLIQEVLLEESKNGQIIRQEAAGLLPAVILDLQESDYVLDLCGSTTLRAVQLIELMENSCTTDDLSGILVINNDELQKANALGQSISRLCTRGSSVIVTNHKPLEFPISECDGYFDKVLCSVPCSGDALFRNSSEQWRVWEPVTALRYHVSQIELLSHGMHQLKVGGTLVYSTRSFNPLENEAVVAEVLRRSMGTYELVKVDFTYTTTKPGISAWKVCDENLNWVDSWENTSSSQKQLLHASMWPPNSKEASTFHLERCHRYNPQDENSNGIFIAVLSKIEKSLPQVASVEAPKNLQKPLKKKAVCYYTPIPNALYSSFKDFMGLEDDCEQNQLLNRVDISGGNTIFYTSLQVSKVLVNCGWNIAKAGIEVMRPAARTLGKINYEFVQEGLSCLLPYVQKRIVTLELDEFCEFLSSGRLVGEKGKRISESNEIVLEGPVVVVLDESDPLQTASRDIALTAWFSQMSLTSTVSKVYSNRLLGSLDRYEDEEDEEEDLED